MKNNKIGFTKCLFILIGGCIGSAIYSLSGMTIYYAGPSAILSWIIAGIILMAYGMIVAELAIRYNESGGVFVFPYKSIGQKNKKLGFYIAFMNTISYCIANIISIAFSAICISTYLGSGFDKLSNMQIPLAILVILLATVFSFFKIKNIGIIQNVLVLMLIITMLIYIFVACFSGTFDTSRLIPFFTQGIKGRTGFISAIAIAQCAYGACVGVSFMVSNIENPNKNIPKSLIIGLIICIILYSLVIFSIIGNLDIKILLDDRNAFYRYVPIFASIWTSSLSKYSWLIQLISISAFLALFTTIFAILLYTIKTLQITAKFGFFPKFLSYENKKGVPIWSAVIIGIICIVLSCFPQKIEILVNLACIFIIINMIITCISLIVSRKIFKLSKKDYKAPLGKILPIITIISLIACYIPDIIKGGIELWVFTLVIYILATIYFFIINRKL